MLTVATESISETETKSPVWKLGLTSYSLRGMTLFEAIDQAKSLGIKSIEPFEGHKLEKDAPAKFGRDMSEEQIAKLRKKLKDSDVTLVGFYTQIPSDKKECEHLFKFAKKVGAKMLVSEPDPTTLPMIDEFCKKYEIALALHNHPVGKSVYWDPAKVVELCKNRSKWVGLCADLGHWQRSGIKPADGLRTAGTRLITLHVKDINATDGTGHDVSWGTGKGDLAEAFKTVHELGINPIHFGIEYDAQPDNLIHQIQQCKKFFDEQVQKQQKSR
jgi:sugar phosphate isomerase/epimerase